MGTTPTKLTYEKSILNMSIRGALGMSSKFQNHWGLWGWAWWFSSWYASLLLLGSLCASPQRSRVCLSPDADNVDTTQQGPQRIRQIEHELQATKECTRLVENRMSHLWGHMWIRFAQTCASNRKFFNHESELQLREKYDKIRNWETLWLGDYRMLEIFFIMN